MALVVHTNSFVRGLYFLLLYSAKSKDSRKKVKTRLPDPASWLTLAVGRVHATYSSPFS